MPAARKTAPRKLAAVETVDDVEPVKPLIVLKRTRRAEPTPEERVLVFAFQYDDDTPDREFWMPKRALASLALTYLRMVRDDGKDAAAAWVLEKVIGKEAYEALMDDDQLSMDELAVIIQTVLNAVVGQVSPPKAPRR